MVRTTSAPATASAGEVASTAPASTSAPVRPGDGFRPGATYRVVVEATDGREVDAGAFIGTGAAPMVCNLNSSVLRPDASGFKVLDTAGSTVLRGDLTPA